MSQFRVAMMYAQGKGVPRNDSEAAHWWNEAARQMDPDLTFDRIRTFGVGGAAATSEPVSLIRHLADAEKNNPRAQFLVGFAYRLGIEVARDSDKMLEYFREAAAAGDPHAQYWLADLYLAFPDIALDDHSAEHWLKQAAENDHCQAQLELVLCYLRRFDRFDGDDGTAVTLDEARVTWLRKAAARSPAAQALLRCVDKVDASQDEKAFAYETALLDSDPERMFSIGCRYASGRGVDHDPEQAKLWWTRAAVMGHPAAWNMLRCPLFEAGLGNGYQAEPGHNG